jgi:hypothetical protein
MSSLYWFLNSTTSTSLNYSTVSASDNGQYILVSGRNTQLLRSSDYGATFQAVGTSRNFTAVYITRNGKYGVASTQDGIIVQSSDYGATWTQNSSFSNSSLVMANIVCSENGQYILTADTVNVIVSTNGGTSWTTNAYANVSQLAISSTGQYMVMTTGSFNGNGYLYVSNNYGSTWTTKTGNNYKWFVCAMSQSGQYIIANNLTDNKNYYSSDYGSTWNSNSYGGGAFNFFGMDSTGQYIIGGVYNQPLYLSSNYGVTFTQTLNQNQQWFAGTIVNNTNNNTYKFLTSTHAQGLFYATTRVATQLFAQVGNSGNSPGVTASDFSSASYGTWSSVSSNLKCKSAGQWVDITPVPSITVNSYTASSSATLTANITNKIISFCLIIGGSQGGSIPNRLSVGVNFTDGKFLKIEMSGGYSNDIVAKIIDGNNNTLASFTLIPYSGSGGNGGFVFFQIVNNSNVTTFLYSLTNANFNVMYTEKTSTISNSLVLAIQDNGNYGQSAIGYFAIDNINNPFPLITMQNLLGFSIVMAFSTTAANSSGARIFDFNSGNATTYIYSTANNGSKFYSASRRSNNAENPAYTYPIGPTTNTQYIKAIYITSTSQYEYLWSWSGSTATQIGSVVTHTQLPNSVILTVTTLYLGRSSQSTPYFIGNFQKLALYSGDISSAGNINSLFASLLGSGSNTYSYGNYTFTAPSGFYPLTVVTNASYDSNNLILNGSSQYGSIVHFTVPPSSTNNNSTRIRGSATLTMTNKAIIN